MIHGFNLQTDMENSSKQAYHLRSLLELSSWTLIMKVKELSLSKMKNIHGEGERKNSVVAREKMKQNEMVRVTERIGRNEYRREDMFA